MSKGNSNLINEAQSLQIKNQYNIAKTIVDIDVNGFDHYKGGSFTKTSASAYANEVLLWLKSKPLDFVRASDNYPSILYSCIGRKLSDEEISSAEEQLRQGFNNRGFGTNLNIIYLKLTPDRTNKFLTIDFIVQDKATGTVASGSGTVKN